MPSKEALDVRNKILEKNLEHCKNLTPEQVDTVISLSKDEKELPLLQIELENETSVPKVFFKGKEITHKINVSFDWETDTDVYGGLSYAIEHIVTGESYPVTNRIERRVKGHATT